VVLVVDRRRFFKFTGDDLPGLRFGMIEVTCMSSEILLLSSMVAVIAGLDPSAENRTFIIIFLLL
jgi:hypothetical protein